MKYDFTLDLNDNNSLSLILKRIKSNSTILEFGCANGRLTKYLTLEMQCHVTVVEIEEEAGLHAKPYAVKALLGESSGNIENYMWCDELVNETFDYIIFADVLEHLHNPEQVLKRCKPFLDIDGSIIVSIPNIANNSIIINLLQDEFEYQNTGLLDNTHIKFYTYHTFNRMIERLDYQKVYETGTYTRIGENEFHVDFVNLQPSIKRVLLDRPFGDIYQHIFQFKNKDLEGLGAPSFSMYTRPLNIYYQSVVYYLQEGIANEYHTIKQGVKLGLNEYMISVKSASQVRFDPINTSVIISKFEIIDIHGNNIPIQNTNAEVIYNDKFYFANYDPNILFSVDEDSVGEITIKYEVIDFELEESIVDFISEFNQTVLRDHENDRMTINNQKNVIAKNVIEIEGLKSEIVLLKEQLLNKDKRIAELDNNVINLNSEVTALANRAESLNERVTRFNRKKYHLRKI